MKETIGALTIVEDPKTEVLQVTREVRRKPATGKTTRVRKEYLNTEVETHHVESGKLKLALLKIVGGSDISVLSYIANFGSIIGSFWALCSAVELNNFSPTIVRPIQFMVMLIIFTTKVIEEFLKHQKIDKRTQTEKIEWFLEEIKPEEERNHSDTNTNSGSKNKNVFKRVIEAICNSKSA